MDRLAYQNMTTKHKHITDQEANGTASLNRYSQPTGELTSKSKINTRTDDYYLERQSKNSQDYSCFVTALNSNIVEDQYRTDVNNDRYFNKPQMEDNLQRVYHPTLMTEQEQNFCNADRCGLGLGTRDRQINAVAKSRNTPHQMTPMPKLNYPHGYDQMPPIEMDLTSDIESQFNILTDQDMDQQIAKLNKNSQTIEPKTTEFICPAYPGYNPQADYMNQQLAQLAQQVPPQHICDCARMIDFQRPLSSNSKVFQTQPQQPQQVFQAQPQPQPQQFTHMNQPRQFIQTSQPSSQYSQQRVQQKQKKSTPQNVLKLNVCNNNI